MLLVDTEFYFLTLAKQPKIKTSVSICLRYNTRKYLIELDIMGQIAYKLPQVRMVELVDTQDLGSCAERCEGSSPFTDTKLFKPLIN